MNRQRIFRIFASLLLGLIYSGTGRAQTTLLSEGFDAFPAGNGWSTGDSNAASGLVFWGAVNSSFGSIAAHTGPNKGYCAGVGFAGTSASPFYTNNMQAYMIKTLNLSGFTGANLDFYFSIPSIENGFDNFRVYMDSTLLQSNGTAVAGWNFVNIPLNSFLGGSHALRFEFDADFSNTGEGAYLDDILVDAANQPTVSTLRSLTNANYTGYVLDSDTASGRSNLQAQAVFTVENFTGVASNFTNVLSYRLINTSNNNAHPIYDFGNTVTNGSYTYNITNVLSLPAGTNLTVSNTAFIRPAALMSQFNQFYLECRMLTNGVLAQTLTTAPTNYYHFTNTVSGDVAWNVLLNLTGSSWTRTYAVKTISGQNTFQVNAPYEIRRWDDVNLAVATTNIPVIFSYTLRDNTGNVIPLTGASQVFNDSVNNHAAGPNPTFISTSHTLDIQPSGQLDSVNKTYYLTVTISHTNNPVTGQVLVANSQQTTTNELLHFDGNLIFGGATSIGTTMTGLAGVPPANPPSGGVIPTTLANVNGFMTSKTDHTYSGAGPLGVSLNSAGDATVTSGTATLIGPPSDIDSIVRVNFQRGNVTLTASNATANITTFLPTGFGYRLNDTSSQVLQSTILFSTVSMNASLDPASDLTFQAAGSTIYAVEENKPVWFVSNKINWHVSLGTFDFPPIGPQAIFVRANAYAYLQSVSNSLVDPPNMGDKRSNDKYWLTLAGVNVPSVRADTGSNSLLTANFGFGSGSYRAHFPYDTVVQWSGGGGMQVTDDLVQTGPSSVLAGVASVGVPYTPNCPDCGSGSGVTNPPTINPSNNILNFTLDGGLIAAGPTTGNVDLQWGFINTGSLYAQQALGFTSAAFHMPGLFLRGDQNLLPAVQGPATILYTGFAASNLTVMERPLSAGYTAGLADYAGMNFRCGTDSVHTASSTIAGTPGINWKLTGRSKYYVRPGGVTGIHESVPGTFPTNLTLWGYAFTFTSYGLSYLDSQNKDSLTDGAISLPFPAQFIQGFNNMKFSCLGAPQSGDLPQGDGFKVMSYWLADFVVHSMQFKSTNGCSPGAGFLVLGIEGYASHVDKALYGQVGFFPSGDQIPPSFGLGNTISRLKLPNVIKYDGANKTTYVFTPAQDAFYNTWSNAPSGGTPGWISIFGKVDVPFFEDMQLHLQTSCHTNGVAASNAPIYLSGGWPRPGSGNPNYGWLDVASHTPFETNLFDSANAGWPGNGGGLTIDNYRNNGTNQMYHPRAQRLWLGFVDFDYPLSWDSTLRSFKSSQEISNNLFVVNIQHQVKYMDAQHAEIDFGAQYDGLPKISIANLAFNAINDATGVGDAIVKAAAQPVEDVLSSGLDEMDQMLDAQMKRMMDGVFNKTVDPLIDRFYTQLSNDFYSLTITQRLQFVQNVQSNALNLLTGTGVAPAVSNLTFVLKDLGDGVSAAGNLIGQLQGYLRDASNAIASVTGVLSTTTNGQAIGSNVVGLINQVGGDRPVVPKLINSLVGDIAPQFINATIGPVVSNVLSDLNPALTQISQTLNETQDAISFVSSNLNTAGEFTSEISNTLANFSAELSNVSLTVSGSVTQYFGQFNYTIDDPFQHVSASDVKQFIRQKVEDAFFSTTAASQIQTSLRQRLYDVDAAMKAQIDSVFQQMNGALRGLISQSLAQLDNSINKCLGDASDVIGAGKLDGHALIDGDSLKELRIDGHFQFKVPDDMELDAFLLIKELQSDGSSSCYSSNAPATEVTIGATGVPLDWASPGLKANVEAKFTFDGTVPFPVNLGGQLELIGELDFKAFQLHDLAAALAFGKYENYLALKGGVRFDGYDFSGAIFFGRTCSLDPLLLIDPDVAKVLGNPPFTGAYCYAQGWLPISEIVLDVPPSCLFDISAGVGAGAFYFAEGPTFGGKMFLGVSGQLLCIVSIEGDVTMVGVAHGSGDFALSGHGHFEADLGPCPFCLQLSKDVTITFVHNSFDIQ